MLKERTKIQQQDNIFDLLHSDHEEILRCMDELASMPIDNDDRKEKFKEVRQLLTRHSRMEEETMYPVLKNHDVTHASGLESEEEHRMVKLMLGELSLLPKNSDKWAAKFTVLKENVEHHIQEEEKEVWPQMQETISETELDNLADDMRNWKQKYYVDEE